jgi:5-dehydro-2-deoxygluconokinase
MAKDLDLITVGRISVDLFAEQINTSFSQPQTFHKSIGGSPTNVAVAAAKLGHNSAIVTKVGEDPLGEYVVNKLRSFQVNTDFVKVSESGLTPVVLASQDPPEDPKIIFYRQPFAPDTQLQVGDLDTQALLSAKIFWVSACALSQGPTAESIYRWLEQRGTASQTIIDLDYRPSFWKDISSARNAAQRALSNCTIAIGNITECDVALGIRDPHKAAQDLLDRGVILAIVKMGGDGVMLATKDEIQIIKPMPIKLVCGLGAGDAFGGALVHGLLSGWDLKQIGEFANSAGAYLASELMCSDAMPTIEILNNFIDAGGKRK